MVLPRAQPRAASAAASASGRPEILVRFLKLRILTGKKSPSGTLCILPLSSSQNSVATSGRTQLCPPTSRGEKDVFGPQKKTLSIAYQDLI